MSKSEEKSIKVSGYIVPADLIRDVEKFMQKGKSEGGFRLGDVQDLVRGFLKGNRKGVERGTDLDDLAMRIAAACKRRYKGSLRCEGRTWYWAD